MMRNQGPEEEVSHFAKQLKQVDILISENQGVQISYCIVLNNGQPHINPWSRSVAGGNSIIRN